MSKHIEDIIMKNIMELFKGDAVKFFGINEKVVSATRTELSHIQVQKNIDDWVLLTEDNTLIHFEFQTTDKQDDIARFMISDAMLYYKERKPVRTIVVYSSEIENTITSLACGTIQYQIETFYMSNLDGDKIYGEIKAKIDDGQSLTKSDLMSIVFLPLMKNSIDRVKRIEQAIEISKKLKETDEQLQIQAMLDMLAEKFIKDKTQLSKIREMLDMGVIAEMIATDKAIEIAKNALKEGSPLDFIAKITGLDSLKIKQLQEELSI